MSGAWNSIAIIGAGPAGCTLAVLLARAGKKVALFSSGERPKLVVGESLIPAVIPILRRLGIEDEVKTYSMYKPGATFRIDEEERHYDFGDFGGGLPHYAYNVPRERFDATLHEAAAEAGAQMITESATLEVGAHRPTLNERSAHMARDSLSTDPDLIVDATGRRRLFSTSMNLPSNPGDRNDAVIFAHIDGANTTREGYIHIGRLTHGWHWFIPLPGRMSMGIVMSREAIQQYGETNEARFDHLLANEAVLSEYAPDAKRLTPVMNYTNYQMVTLQSVGEGWALVGDAAGFIDPIFSSGLYLSMDGGAALADAILEGTEAAMQRYQRYSIKHIEAWHRVARYFYSGKMFALFQMRQSNPVAFIERQFKRHIYEHVGRVLTGQAATRRYSLAILNFMTKHAVSVTESERLSVQ